MTTAQFRAPFPLHPTALLDTADNSINNPGTGSPSRETIHRAISTAYYALFHAINASNADITHGGPTNTLTAQAWTNTYRQMRHNFAATHLNHHLFRLAPNGRITQCSPSETPITGSANPELPWQSSKPCGQPSARPSRA